MRRFGPLPTWRAAIALGAVAFCARAFVVASPNEMQIDLNLCWGAGQSDVLEAAFELTCRNTVVVPRVWSSCECLTVSIERTEFRSGHATVVGTVTVDAALRREDVEPGLFVETSGGARFVSVGDFP